MPIVVYLHEATANLNCQMASIVFALCAAALYGSADFLGGLAARRSAVMPVMIFSQLAGSCMLVAVLAWLPTASATSADWLWGTVAGIALAIGLTQLYQALALGKMSLAAPVTAVLAVIFSGLVGQLSGDRLSLVALAGIALALAAIVLISQDGGAKNAHPDDGKCSARILPIALSAGFFIGVFFSALKQISTASGLLPLASARLTALLVLAVVALSRRTPLHVGRDSVWLILLGGALDIMANVLYVVAVRHGILTIAATLTSLYPASTIILARFVLGERLRAIQLAGLSCAGLGVVLIGAG
jgi:drug/metabolite transporter (DMT)-like permease